MCSVIQTVFNTFLSILDRRFHGMIKVVHSITKLFLTRNLYHQFIPLPFQVIPNSGQRETLKDMLGEYILPILPISHPFHISGEAVLPEEYGGTNGTIDEHRYKRS